MARNQEKAQAMLNRLIIHKRMELKGPVEIRPHLASDCNDLHECDKWRQQIIKEVSKEVTLIQNGSLGEHKIRDLNDHINKLLREKKHWERQIKSLGGPDHIQTAPRVLDGDGKQAMGADGYYYFGAARELPGVRELFEKIVPEAPKRTRFDLYKCIDADYYGYRDEDDGLLEKLERQQEKRARDEAVREWMLRNKKQRTEAVDEEDYADLEGTREDVYKAYVPLPTQEEIEKLILEKRRQELLAKLQDGEEDEDLEEELTKAESLNDTKKPTTLSDIEDEEGDEEEDSSGPVLPRPPSPIVNKDEVVTRVETTTTLVQITQQTTVVIDSVVATT